MDWRNRKKVGQCLEDAAPDVNRALFFLMLPSLFPPHSHTCIITSTCTQTLFTVLSLSISPGNRCVEVFQSMSHFSPFAQFASCSSIHTTVPLSPSLLFDIQVECKGPFTNRPFKQARLYASSCSQFWTGWCIWTKNELVWNLKSWFGARTKKDIGNSSVEPKFTCLCWWLMKTLKHANAFQPHDLQKKKWGCNLFGSVFYRVTNHRLITLNTILWFVNW